MPQGTISGQTLAVLFFGVGLAAAFGYVDDRWQIRARWQALSQVILAAITIGAGVVITFIYNPLGFLGDSFGGDELQFGIPTAHGIDWNLGTFGNLGYLLAVVISTIWIVGMINSINFIDGLDGLSTGSRSSHRSRSACCRSGRSSRWSGCSAPSWRVRSPGSCPGTSTRRGSSRARPG